MFQLKLAASFIAKNMGITTADLSTVTDPKGRLDFLASKLIETAAAALPPDVRATYEAARPIIDGFFVQQFGKIRVAIPEAVENKVKGL